MGVTGPGMSDHGERLVWLVRAKGFEQATADDDLLDLGLTSLQILQLSEDIEHELGIPVDLETLLAAPTIGELGRRLMDGGPAT
jgi:aryl carrier-like protein